jgi:tetratricopeptide (TPR) repeat protein
MTRSGKILWFAGLAVFCLAVTGWFVIARGNVPKTGSEALNRAIELQKAGRYDSAVRVLQTWMKGTSRNTSHDGFLYLQIAMIYIAKAYKNPTTKAASIHEAQLNLEESLDFANKRDPEDNSFDLDGIGSAYEILGDLSEPNKCEFYETAKQIFVRELPLIKGDSYTAYGKTVPLEPVRIEIKKHLDQVNEKYPRAGCKAFEGK